MANKPTYEELEQRVLELEKTETERKQVEKPEERLKAMSDASFEAIFLSEKGICFDQSQTAKKMFGYTRAEAIGRHGTEWIVPKDHEQVKNNMASGYEKPYKVTALKKAGDTFPAEIQARMTEYQGRSIRITALRDISDRKQAEEALYESEAKYKSLTNNLNVGVYRNSVGSKGKFIEANPAIVKMFGYDSREEFLKIGVSHLYLNPLERKEFTSKVAKAGSIKNEVLGLQKKDGTEFLGSVSAVAVKNEKGDIKYFDGIIEDITERKRAEESLKKTQERFRTVVEQSSAAIEIYEPNGRLLIVNDAWAKFWGLKKEAVADFNILADPECEKTGLASAFRESQQGRARILSEVLYDAAESGLIGGRKRWISARMYPIVDQKRTVQNIVLTYDDITERKQAEEALRESEERFSSMFEHTSSGVAVYEPVNNGEDFVFKAFNSAAERITRISREEALGNRLLDLFPNMDKSGLLGLLQKVWQTGQEEHLPPFYYKDELREGWRENRLYKLPTGEVVALFDDVTERKQAEEALRASEEKYRTVLESSPDPVVVYDMEGRVIYLNPAFTRVFGWSLEEQIGKKIDDFVPEKNMSETRKMINKVTVAGESFSGLETRRYTKEGNILDISISGSCYKDHEGNVAASVINLRDITEQKRLETHFQQASKMEAVGTLAGGVAHDLNNILGGLVSYPELLLLQISEDSPLRKSILTIQKSGEKAAAVVQDLLTLARRGVVATEVVNLNNVISEYLKSPEHEKLQSYHPGVHIETHLEKDVLNILGSSTHLSKTVMNLVSNAAEAMPVGGKLTVTTENRYIDTPIRGYEAVKEGDYMVFTISDTGTGISPNDIEKIFEPFYTKKKMGKSGTGLGMAVVWGTVKDHNGYIDVQSTEGKGTTFTLYFSATREKLSEDKSHSAIESYSGNGESILIVDDVEQQRQIASGMLEALGYSVVSVSSGEEAVEYLKTNKVHLLVLDMIMDPGMDGLDTYKKIIEMHPDQKAIVASGFSETDRVKEVLRLGAGTYIRKPFLLEKIGLAVKEELEK